MAIKIIYVNPDDLVEIRIVHDKDEKPCKDAWQSQLSAMTQPMLLSIRRGYEIGYHDPAYKFRLEDFTGKAKRYLS